MIPKPKTVLELFEGHPERWTKGAFAKNANGDCRMTCDPEAVCFCLLGGLTLVYGYNLGTAEKAEQLQIPKGYTGVDDFNDAPGTTFEMVLEVVRKAGV
jgi:hypothetical protein